MKKMPCLFVREFDGPRVKGITSVVTLGCEWVLAGEGTASVKWDGTACLVEDGKLFKRYDFKAKVREKSGSPPEGFRPCQPEPDPVTGHHPGWVPVLADDPQSKWHRAAWVQHGPLADGTYELCGPHFQGNPCGFAFDLFLAHGAMFLDPPLTFDGLRGFLAAHEREGVVFAHPDGRMAKIRRADFGLPWPLERQAA